MSAAEMVLAKLLHDMATPLASLGLNLDTLDECREEHRPKVLKLAKRNLAAILDMAEKRRAFIRSRGSKRLYSIGTATASAVDACKERFDPDAQVTAAVDVVSDFEVSGSPELWDSLVQNLLTNAVRAVQRNAEPNERTIQVKIERIDDQHGSVTFTDTGIGMNCEQLEKFWEPSFTTQESGSWHGLGKLIIKDAVEFHGGQIEISSTPNVGTTFSVTLPIAGLGVGNQL